MALVQIILKNLPPQPRNATHEKTPHGFRLSDLAYAFQDDIRERLSRTRKKDYFKNCDSVKLELVVYTPESQFFTSKKKLSKTSIDADAHKLLLDELAKYFGFNDGLVWDFNVIKLPIAGDEWCFKVSIYGEENTTWPVMNISTLTSSSPEYQNLD